MSMTGEHRGPQFNMLVAELRRQMAQEAAMAPVAKAGTDPVEKMMAAREHGEAVMRRAMNLFRAGRLTAADIAVLHAVRLQHEDIV